MNPFFSILAQINPALYDDAPSKPAANKGMAFHDLQRGFQQYNAGETDKGLATGLLFIVAIIAVVALIIHLRNRAHAHKTPDSESILARELSRLVAFPFASKWILRWVARHNQVHVATLLVSPTAFDTCLRLWRSQPTFALLRSWGGQRLDVLRKRLF